MRIAVAAIVGLMWSASVARADLELKNDGFVTGGTAGFQGGFVAGEIGASRFVAPEAGRQLIKVQLLYGGGSTATQTITLKVYDDSDGADTPGAELHSADYQLTGSDSAMQEITLPSSVTVPLQFRVGILFQDVGAPSIARDADNTIDASKNYIFGVPGGWFKSNVAGLTGDWVIRAFITDGGVTPQPDAGVTGASCTGNANCPEGQFCDLAAHACTFECRFAADCGGGTCNSLGQCVGGGSGGGCCRTDPGSGTGGALFGVGVLGAILWRRRRR